MTDSSASVTSASMLWRIRIGEDVEATWAQFVDKYGGRIHSWCRRWGLQEADAEDVTQDVLLRLYRKLQDFEYDPNKGQFRGWLHHVAKNVWCDFCEKSKRPGRGSGSTDILQEIYTVRAQDDFLRELDKAFEREILEEAMHRVQLRVSTGRWEAFYLTELEGLSGKDVAQRLNMKVGTVHQARHQVKRMIHEEVCRETKHDSSSIRPGT